MVNPEFILNLSLTRRAVVDHLLSYPGYAFSIST
jgi:hypothetical protein